MLYLESFAGLDKLERLRMGHCALMSIDFSIFGHLNKLKELDLSRNQLITIKAAPVDSIKVLHINNNQLTEFPAKHTDFIELHRIYVKNNNFTCDAIANTFRSVELDCESTDAESNDVEFTDEEYLD